MPLHQPGILADVPRVGRYLWFQLKPSADPRPALARLCARELGEEAVVGIGSALVSRPVTGNYFWCPPVKNGRLDLSAVGL